MATDKWLSFAGTEIVNLARTAQLAEAMGIDAVWPSPTTVQWIENAVGGADYGLVNNAPWYDPEFPASSEFAGVVPLGFPGLEDSSLEASTTEFITDGGRSGRQRNASQTIVASVGLIGLTDRGVEYGKRWLDGVLRDAVGRANCSGAELRFYRYEAADAPVVHRRQVRLTRGTSVTRKRSVECSVAWLVTFTLNCDDPFTYGEPIARLADLGGLTAPTGAVITSGHMAMVEETCPVYDYTPVYDPLYPALVPSPTAPDLLPAGWTIGEGDTFDRFWARVDAPVPSTQRMVPFIVLSSDVEARMVRVSIWPNDSPTNDQCDPLFSAVVSYLPSSGEFYIDGEQEAAYVWDGFSAAVRRSDSLVYSPNAKPVEWAAFNDPTSLLITLDLFTEGSGIEGDGDVRCAVSFIPKSD